MRMRRNNWSAYASVLGLTGGCLAIGACSDQAAYETGEVESRGDGVIIGTNDLVVVQAGGSNLPAKYQPYVNAFGRLHMSSGLCTATHLGNGIAITAGHCWEAGATRQDNTSCSGSYVEWGYIGSSSASRSDCTTVLAKQQSSGTNKLDYAIFKVSPVPPDYVPVDFSQKAPSGTTLTIFSHPQGRPLEWSKTCALQSPGSTQLSYQCDTEAGSSGATVLEDSTLQVTGIHWGGGGSANSATFILSTPIREFLQPPDGGGGGAGGAAGAGGGGGKAGAAGAAGGGGGKADAGDAATGDASDASSDGPRDGATDGTGGSAGAAGASGAGGASGSGGAAGTGGGSGTGGTAGKGGAGGTGGSGTGGGAGKGGAAGSAGGSGGASGSGGATGGAAGSTGGAAGGSAGSSSGGKGGTGGSTTGTGGTGTSDDGGCSCRIGTGSNATGGDHLRTLLVALGVGVVGLRRRRKPTRASR